MKYLLSAFTILLLICSSSAQNGYICNIDNCQMCSSYNFCGLCNNNYMLQINLTTSIPYCQAVLCAITNCQTCYQNNTCSVCGTGFYVNGNGTCTSGAQPTCTSGCLACNSTSCQLCQFGFNLQNGACFPNNGQAVSNCQSYFTGYACQLCQSSYIISPSYQCQSPIPTFVCNLMPNCQLCSSSTSCLVCSQGYQLTLTNNCTAQSCTVPNCLQCQGSTCTACINGYELQAGGNGQCLLQVYSCGIQNCLYCQQANICGTCASGYVAYYYRQNGKILMVNCSLITKSVGGTVAVSNCAIFGVMVPGTSELEIGCVTCQDNFTNVGGYCVANLSLSSYICSIPNCLYCIQNNICGKCQTGFISLIGSPNTCTPDFSPYPNCAQTPLFDNICTRCQGGFTLVNYQKCSPMPPVGFVCNFTGCSFCTQNNTCAGCLNGYDFVGNVCTAICAVGNCYECGSSTQCAVCNLGYVLQASGTSCVSAANQTVDYCQATFNSFCTQCTYYNCLQCSNGYSLNPYTGICCPTPPQNVANCASYQLTWSTSTCTVTVTCTLCSPGSLMVNAYRNSPPQCTSIPCSLPNCTYCFQTLVCAVCNPGFTLVNNTCVAYQNQSGCITPNCVACNPSNQCVSCLTGYLLYNGSCVCGFQNCLACQGSVYCTACAFPTVATMVSSAGCLPQIVPNTYCPVPNCLNCLTNTTCSQCFTGFSLQPSGTCTLNTCNRANNCLLCNIQQSICFQCLPGYILSNILSSHCISIPANYSCLVTGCAVCKNGSANVCQTCSPFYQLNNGTGGCQLIPCGANCVYCFAAGTCAICDAGFYLSTGGNCVPGNANAVACPNNYAHCVGCQNQTVSGVTTTICIQCAFGLQPSPTQTSCIAQTCSVPNCQICVQTPKSPSTPQLCFVCQQSYFLNSYFQCIPYPTSLNIPNCSNIYNCLYCSSSSYCTYCVPGWNATNGICVTSSLCANANCLNCTSANLCLACASNYQLNNASLCVPNCGIVNCGVCNLPNICATCVGNLTVINNGAACGCPDNTFNISNGNCICPNGTTILTTGVNPTCISCNISNCISCSSANVCQTCSGNLTVQNSGSQCLCPDQTFSIVNGSCLCPNATTISPSGTTCIGCNINNCISCLTANVCTTCVGNLTVLNNGAACGCPDNTFNVSNGNCVCPNGTTILTTGANPTCISCNITYCISCSAANVCQTCTGNLTSQNSGSTCACPDTTFSISNGSCICPQGFSLLQSTCISCNVTNCQTCSSANVCKTCLNNLILLNSTTCGCQAASTQVNASCVACSVFSCLSCSAENYCAQCESSFAILNGTCYCPGNTTLYGVRCVDCNVTNCTTCQSANVCATCAVNFTLLASGTGSTTSCIPCYVQNCFSCSAPNYCSSCNSSLVPNSLGSACINCQVSNCTLCVNSTYCAVCQPGYQLQPGGLCSPCEMTGCAVCSTPTNCLRCMIGYVLNTGICQLCLAPCTSCSTTNPYLCSTCAYPYSQTAAPNGTCFTCNTPNCLICSPSNTYACLNCTSSYTLTSNSTCIYSGPCSINCLNCLLGQVCTQCQDGYAVNATNGTQCVQCTASNCVTCSGTDVTTCLVCNAGFYVSRGICVPCPFSNCQTCTATACITYQVSTGQIAVTYNNVTQPVVCDPQCKSCSNYNPSSCTECYPGFILNNARTCIPCNFPCKTCSLSNLSLCYQCFGNAFITGASCLTCNSSSNCLTCSMTNLSQCTTCPLNYNLNSTSGICVLGCPSNCAVCSSSTQCTICSSGFSVNPQGACLPCLSNCRVCSGTAQGICLQCGLGFYLNQFGTCASCPQNCITCNTQGCIHCAHGYSLSAISTCVPNCATPCASCLFTNISSCTSCLLGYSYNSTSNSCAPITNCPGGVCFACPLGYYLVVNSCLPCTASSNCARCLPALPSQCISCLNGYYINPNAGTCSPCSGNCSTCSNAQSCQSCIQGFTLALEPVNSQGQCVKCQSPCSQCVGNPTTCISCIAGYKLAGWNCMTNFNFGFFVSFNTTPATFYNNYQQFLLLLLQNSTTTPNIQSITITNITSSSSPSVVNISGSVSCTHPSGSLSAGNQFYTLNSTLTNATNSTILGMPVLASAVNINGGNVPPQPEPEPQPSNISTLAIILGICIPIAIIIIGIIIFCIVQKVRSKNNLPVDYAVNNTTVRDTFQLGEKERVV